MFIPLGDVSRSTWPYVKGVGDDLGVPFVALNLFKAVLSLAKKPGKEESKVYFY